MGFKPSSLLKKYYHVKPAQFIYPDETVTFLRIKFLHLIQGPLMLIVLKVIFLALQCIEQQFVVEFVVFSP